MNGTTQLSPPVADPSASAATSSIVSLIVSLFSGVVRRTFLVTVVAIPTQAMVIYLIAAYRIAPHKGIAFATAVGLIALATCILCTAWFAVANAVLRSAADAVAKHGLAQSLVERAFALACQAFPTLGGHEVSERIAPEDWSRIQTGVQRLRELTCGDGRGIRNRLAAWTFDAIAKRLEDSITLVLGDLPREGQPVQLVTIPSLAARLVNRSIAETLRSGAWRAGVLWFAILLAIFTSTAASRG